MTQFSSELLFFQTLPLLAMIKSITCDQIYTYLSEYRDFVNARHAEDADETYLSYDEMDSEQQEWVYQVLYADQVRFTEELAVKAVNQIGFEAEDGKRTSCIYSPKVSLLGLYAE